MAVRSAQQNNARAEYGHNGRKAASGQMTKQGRSAHRHAGAQAGTVEKVPVQTRKHRYYYDYTLLSYLILIFAIGLIIIYSGSQYMAMQERHSATYYFNRQLMIGGTGLVFGIVASLFDYKILKGYVARFGYFLSVGMLTVTLILGTASHGKTRWMQIAGSSFQPTELAKIGLIVFLAAYISERGPAMNKKENIIRMIGFAAVPALLIFTQNISSGIIVAMIAAVMLFVAVENHKVFYGLLTAAVGGIIALKPVLHWWIIRAGYTESPSQYWLKRIFGWAAPEVFENDAYQTVQGLYAIGSGGLTGHGLGESIQKYGAIPEVQNDMIFTIICEEFGFIGAALIIILYINILVRIYETARNSRDMFGTMLCAGVMAHIGLQVVLNIAVVTAVIPNTGVTLPFISYGGSAVFFTMLEMGMVLSVAHRIRE